MRLDGNRKEAKMKYVLAFMAGVVTGILIMVFLESPEDISGQPEP